LPKIGQLAKFSRHLFAQIFSRQFLRAIFRATFFAPIFSLQYFAPIFNKNTGCLQFIVHVKDTDPPRVKQCPTSFTVTLPSSEASLRVTWKEPIFTDNIKVSNIVFDHFNFSPYILA
jgi:hypothetical protein